MRAWALIAPAGLGYQLIDCHGINRRFAVPVAGEEDPLAIRRKNGRHHFGIAGAVLGQRQLALGSPHQQQNIRRRLAAAGADEDAGIPVASEVDELCGIGDHLVVSGVGYILAEIVQLVAILRIV